jgi:hypothetical protein
VGERAVFMGKVTRFGVLGALVVAGTLVLSGGTAMVGGASPASTAYTCTGGDLATNTFIDIPSGSYSSITVAGVCDVPDKAKVSVVGNINVLAGAVLDAQTAPSTITVGHNVTAASGSLLGLGCQPNGVHAEHACMIDPSGSSVVTVNGNITTTNSNTALLNGITVNGNVTLTGGGGPIPWAIKNNTFGKNLTISGVTAAWLGVLWNQVGGNATLTNVTINDPGDPTPTIQIVENTVGRNLNCSGLGPYVAGGFIPGEVNHVGGKATGQCANLQSGG